MIPQAPPSSPQHTSPGHQWALVDPQGRIHATCSAHTFREAAYALKLSDSQVAEGWTVGDTSSTD